MDIYERILEHTPDAIFSVELVGRIHRADPRTSRLFGYECRELEIRVGLELRAGNQCVLSATDYGVALGANPTNETSLGMRVVRLLARQIGAEFSFEPRNPGTEARLTLNTVQHA